MNFQSTKIIILEQFSIVIFSITEELRFSIREEVNEHELAILELQCQYDERMDALRKKYAAEGIQVEELKVKDLEPRELFELEKLTRRMDQIRVDKIDPVLVKRCLAEIGGVMVNGEPLKAADVRKGPAEVYSAVVREVRKHLGLTPAEVENLESPSTSGAPVDGQTLLTIAPPAVAEGTSLSETAPSIIPSK